jgi:hypothetical protein
MIASVGVGSTVGVRVIEGTGVGLGWMSYIPSGFPRFMPIRRKANAVSAMSRNAVPFGIYEA